MIDFKNKKVQLIAAAVSIGLLITGLILWKINANKPANIPVNAIEVEVEETTEASDNNTDSTEPFDIRIINLSESTFTIFFRTKTPTSAFLRVGQGKELKWKVLDDRVKSDTDDTKFYNHIFKFSDPAAKAESEYVYLLEIEGTRYDNNQDLYLVNLAPLLSSPPAVTYVEVYSSIPTTSEYKDSIIILSNYDANSTVESGYGGDQLKTNNAIISLGSLRTIDKSRYSELDQLKLEIFDAEKSYQTKEFLDFDSDSVYNLVLR